MKWNSCVRFMWWNNMHNQYASNFSLTLSWQRPLWYRNQSIDLLCKWTGFDMITASVMKDLNTANLLDHILLFQKCLKTGVFKNWPRQILSDVFILYLLVVIFKSSHGRVLRKIGYLKTVLIKVFEKYLQKKSLLWT